jgi:uncharacterized protein DUF1810
MPSSPRLRLYRTIRPSLVLSQSFTDRLWSEQNEKWWIVGRSRDQFGPEGPEVSTSAACRSVRDQAAAGDPNLKLEAPHGTDSSQTPRWRETDSNLWYRATKARDFESIPGTQLADLGRSSTARFYGIGSLDEARAYLAHPAGAKARSLHQDRARERESVRSCDFRLAQRFEVPLIHDAVFSGGGRPGKSVPRGSRPLLRRTA